MKENYPIKCVLINVYNIYLILNFVNQLFKKNINLLSTSKTKKILKKNNIFSTSFSDYVQFPDIIINSINVLHPRIHAGVLGKRIKDHNVMLHNRVVPIDMICVDLIPFDKLKKIKNIELENIIKNIEIGNISLIKSAIINNKEVTIVIDKHEKIIEEMNENNDCIKLETKKKLAKKAFKYIVEYEIKLLNFLKKNNKI
ncbi:hypothetical protein [Candidatus Annandia adelgestsuga]|uniref:hypothetical protein n=1 Tax=Candidatus Annandia adelgestsuga TaxID=1302411 RepID=UPI000F7D9F2E|nr:hypothetical protein [Candidatus Annandia adelgestsuga]